MRDFGGRICFWGGGCDTQSVLPRATPQEVREHVRERIRVFTRGSAGCGHVDGVHGGYVFTQVHNVQAKVPPENVQAMLDAAYEFGGN